MEKQLNESTLHRLTAGQNGLSAREEAAKGRLISQVQAYRNLTEVPQTRDLQVCVPDKGRAGRALTEYHADDVDVLLHPTPNKKSHAVATGGKCSCSCWRMSSWCSPLTPDNGGVACVST